MSWIGSLLVTVGGIVGLINWFMMYDISSGEFRPELVEWMISGFCGVTIVSGIWLIVQGCGA